MEFETRGCIILSLVLLRLLPSLFLGNSFQVLQSSADEKNKQTLLSNDLGGGGHQQSKVGQTAWSWDVQVESVCLETRS